MAKKEWHCTCTDLTQTVICVVCAAALVGYSPWTMYAKAERGELPSLALSRRHRLFNRAAVIYWRDNHATGDLAA